MGPLKAAAASVLTLVILLMLLTTDRARATGFWLRQHHAPTPTPQSR